MKAVKGSLNLQQTQTQTILELDQGMPDLCTAPSVLYLLAYYQHTICLVGTAAGITIGFLVLGALLGLLIIFLVNKFRKGGPDINVSFQPKTFENDS